MFGQSIFYRPHRNGDGTYCYPAVRGDGTPYLPSQRNPDGGLPLDDAVLFYGELSDPLRYFENEVAQKCSPDRFSSEQLLEHCLERTRAQNRLVAKLIAGELRATAFEVGAPPNSPPSLIHPERWRILALDFGASSDQVPYGGKSMVGIRVFSGPFFGDAATVARVIVEQETFCRTGFAGRPSGKRFIEAEMKRRAKSGELKSSLRGEAKELADWYAEAHPEDPPCKAGAIRNSFGDLYKRLVSKEEKIELCDDSGGGTKPGTKLF